jgi:hypothetical protein
MMRGSCSFAFVCESCWERGGQRINYQETVFPPFSHTVHTLSFPSTLTLKFAARIPASVFTAIELIKSMEDGPRARKIAVT